MNIIQFRRKRSKEGARSTWAPEQVPFDEAQKVIDQAQRLHGEEVAASRKATEAEAAIPAGRQADVEAAATARLVGKKPPGGGEEEQKAIDAAATRKRAAEAAQLAFEWCLDLLATTVEKNRKTWSAQAATREEAARREYESAIVALSSARETYVTARLIRTWTETFPSELRKPPTLTQPALAIVGSVSDAGRIPGDVLFRSLKVDAGVEAAPLTLRDRLEGKHPPKPELVEADEEETITVAGGRVVPV